MILPTLLLSTVVLWKLAPLLATAVALLATDPTRRTDARRVLRLLLTPTGRQPPSRRPTESGHREL